MLFPDTIIEIIAFKDNKYYKMVMTIAEWKIKPKKKGFRYQMYQLGYSQYKIENI
jgi:hypothetical protein